MNPDRDFSTDVAALRAGLLSDRPTAVAELRGAYEAWARAILGIAATGNLVEQVRASADEGIDPKSAVGAIEKLAAAAQHQREMGTWATGAGEGLASMAELRTLQLAQAWLWLSSEDPAAEANARQLLSACEQDPNGGAARHAPHMVALSHRLSLA